MWPYWVMFLLPAAFALREQIHLPPVAGSRQVRPSMPLTWWGTMILFALLIGLRHEVGGDWLSYLASFEDAIFNSRYPDWWSNDPGYRVLEWVALRMGWGIHAVNLLAAGFFSFGLVVFCRDLPRPWLALAVAVPYLVIILGMGYSRQGTALGCLMVGLVALGRGKVARFVVWTVLAATFHKSAVLLLPVAALAASRRRAFTAVWVMVVVAVAYNLLLEDSVGALNAGYLESEYQSEGAFVRLLMNTIPAALLLWKQRLFALSLPQERLWFWMALAALALFALYFFSPSSTAVDRVGLYLLPLQLMVFAHLPEVLGRPQRDNGGWVLLVVLYYAAVEFVWLNFATHAFAWIPYRWYPLV